jgi:hypothetical protein
MIKAILFLMLVQHTDGQIMYANGFPIDDCSATTISAKLQTLPATPRGMRLEYICAEPGPTRTVVNE